MTKKNKPGELGFALLLLVFSVAVFVMSIQMFVKSSFDFSSYGGVPTIMSGLMVVLMVGVTYRTAKAPSDAKEKTSIGKSLGYVLSRDVLVFLAIVIIYCATMSIGIPFIISTPVFLLVSMQYLMGTGWKWNLIYTVAMTISVYVIFVEIFHVSLP